jgi:hypothetical protein
LQEARASSQRPSFPLAAGPKENGPERWEASLRAKFACLTIFILIQSLNFAIRQKAAVD